VSYGTATAGSPGQPVDFHPTDALDFHSNSAAIADLNNAIGEMGYFQLALLPVPFSLLSLKCQAMPDG
jgi:hypothetical protein